MRIKINTAFEPKIGRIERRPWDLGEVVEIETTDPGAYPARIGITIEDLGENSDIERISCEASFLNPTFEALLKDGRRILMGLELCSLNIHFRRKGEPPFEEPEVTVLQQTIPFPERSGKEGEEAPNSPNFGLNGQ